MPSPPSTGLVLWFNGAGSTFSDFAGAVPAVAPYGRVARVDQASPASAGSWLTPDQTTSRGWQDPGGVDLQYGAKCYFNQPAGLTLPSANKCVFGFSFQYRAGPTSAIEISVFIGSDSVGEIGLVILAGDLCFVSQGTFHDIGLSAPAGAQIYGWAQYGTSTITWSVTINGTLHTGTISATQSTGAVSAMQIGKYRTATYTHCGIAQILGYDNTSGTVDTTALLAYLATQIDSLPTTISLVAASGDSIGAGALVPNELTQFYLAQENLAGSATPFRLVNTAIGGATIADIAGRYATVERPLYSSSRAKNILCVEGITNSMPCSAGSEASHAAAVLSALYAYCDQALSDGFLVPLWTCPPRSDASAGTGFPGCWAIVNADIRANAVARGYILVDVAAVPGMSLISDAAGPNFVDALHPSASGHALIEPVVRTAIQLALAVTPPPTAQRRIVRVTVGGKTLFSGGKLLRPAS